MAFHDAVFPSSISFGSSGGPERRTDIVTLASGFEERNATWAHSRRHYDAGLGVRTLDDVHDVIAFFEARLGMLHGFRWKDWADFKSCAPSETVTGGDQLIGVGDGATTVFQLSKAYSSGGETYARPIRKPVAASVQALVDGALLTPSADYALNSSTGEITFSEPPAAGAPVTAGFEFHVPVRFDTDRIEVNLAGFEAGEIPSIPIVEVRV